MKAILAKKIAMTQTVDEDGKVSAVTVLQAGPCVVTQVKTEETDGYNAVQLGFGDAKKISKPLAGHAKKANAKPRHLFEIRLDSQKKDENEKKWVIGDKVNADLFETGESVTVSGVSKGKGFAGTIKRHNFSRGPMTHGSRNQRRPGSIGAMFPQHVFRGQKMSGRMGGTKVTVKNLKIANINPQNHLIAVTGAVPGPNKGLVVIKGMGK